MTIYYTKYGGIIHNPDAYFKLGGDIYIDKQGALKIKNYIKKIKKEQLSPKINKSVIDKANLFELYEYNKDLKLGYSYFNTKIREYRYVYNNICVTDL
jgi:hypothetical protein